MHCRRWVIWSALVLLGVGEISARAGDWPCWRGPTGQGLTDEKDLPLTWGGKNNDNVLWKVPLPGSDGAAKLDHNQASPIVWKDKVFLVHAFWPSELPQTKFPEHHVLCYQAGDGKLLWDTTVPPGPWLNRDRRGGYSAPTPVTDGERVYVLFGSSVLVALDFSGKILWRKEIVPFSWDTAIGTSPILYQDYVLVVCDQVSPKVSRLVAFDKKTGEIRWERTASTAKFSHGTPLMIQVKGKPQLIVNASETIQGVDPADGKVLWSCPFPGEISGPIERGATTPVYTAGLVYCDSGRGGLGAAVDPTGEGDGGKTHRKWETPKIPGGWYSSPAVSGEYLYRSHAPGLLRCLNMSTGEVLYRERMPAGTGGDVSPIATPEGRIYFASAGKSVVIKAGPKFEVLAVNDLGDSNSASAAVSGGRFFLKGNRVLYCIGKK